MIKKTLITIFTILISAIFIGAALRGLPGNPTDSQLNSKKWTVSGPFEVSPERGRYALTYSLIENHSFFFSTDLARFTTPDLGYKNGHYVSLFAPAVSFIVIPGYIIGRIFGDAQVGTFAVIGFFALLNIILIARISTRLGAHYLAGITAGLIFVFATPAFNYATTLYQHHISTFLILGCIYLLLAVKNPLVLFPISFLIATSIPTDYPNLFLMIPIIFWSLGRLIRFKANQGQLKIQIKPLVALGFVAGVVPLVFFLWFNQKSYNNPLQLSGNVQSVSAIDSNGKPTSNTQFNTENLEKNFNAPREDQAVSFFKTRSAVNGIFILFFSPDRGLISFAPIVLVGLAGIYLLNKRNPGVATVLVGIIGFNIILYSLWGDPWGGWAFGSRYSIPMYAILCIGLALALTLAKRKIVILLAIILLATYCVAVNTAGALTSSANPPQVEVLALEKLSGKVQKYTYERNLDILLANNSKSFIFQTYANKRLSAWNYYLLLACLISGTLAILIIFLRFSKDDQN